VDYDHRSTPRRFVVAIEVGGDVTDEQLARLERVARSCPLRRSIDAGIEFTESIERRPGAAGVSLVEAGRAS
jgi:putative redox protein